MKKLFTVLHILILLCLITTNISVYVSPELLPYISFVGLAYPITLVFTIISTIFSAVLKQKIVFINMAILILSFIHLNGFFGFNLNTTNSTQPQSFKVTSYNVRLFDKYEWLKKGSATKEEIFKELDTLNSDIYCFQEFYYEDKPSSFNTRKELKNLLKAENEFGHYTHHMTGGLHFGLQTFSKFPIIDKGVITFSNDDNNGGIYCDLKIMDDTIRVYNLHLGSIRFQNEDYEVLGEKTKMYKNKKGTQRIVQRLQSAYEKRAVQVNKVIEHISNCTYQTIICGDINDTPISYAYQQLSNGRIDAFIENSFGIGSTYSGKLPAMRIDYILYDKSMSTSDFEIQEATLSDHRAISTIFN